MRKLKIGLLIVLTAAVFLACKKSSSGGGNVDEENLVIALDPDPGSTIVQSLGASYPFNILIQSKMPPTGVDIDISCKKESDNTIVFSQKLQTSLSSTAVSINSLPFNEITIATIVVKSKSKPANASTKTFRLVKK